MLEGNAGAEPHYWLGGQNRLEFEACFLYVEIDMHVKFFFSVSAHSIFLLTHS